jgi:bacterioferritin
MSIRIGASEEEAVFFDTEEIIDVHTLREQARQHIDDGAVTAGYSADRGAVLRVLNNCLATEIIGALRYRRHHFMAKGIHAKAIAEVFLAHANQQQGHADQIAERIVQLGGEPNFSPVHLLNRSYTEYVERYSLINMIHENLVSARVIIDSYREIIEYLNQRDSTTVRLLESLLAAQEECAHVLADFVSGLRRDVRSIKPRPAAHH